MLSTIRQNIFQRPGQKSFLLRHLEARFGRADMVGVTGQVGIGQTYNSLSTSAGASNTAAANRWVFTAQGAGFLAATYGGGGLTYTAGDGSTWKYTTGTGSAFTSPAGAKADLVSGGERSPRASV